MRRPWLWAMLMAGVQAGLLVSIALDKSDTIDEPHDLATAVRQWSERDLVSNCDAPALPKWGFAVALRWIDPPLFDRDSSSGRHPLWSRPPAEMRRNLFAGRTATILVTVVGGLLLWSASRVWGEGVAHVAHALWCFSPNVLAQGALATFDPWAAAGVCLVLWATVRACASASLFRAGLVGIAIALASASKVTALGTAPVAVLTLLVVQRKRGYGMREALGRTIPVLVGFALTLWTVYGFAWSWIDTASLCGRATGWPSRHIGPLPFAPWIEGLLVQWRHGTGGHLGYLFGRVSGDGWWWFYFAALAFKTTVGAQGLVLLRLVTFVRDRMRRHSLAIDAALLAYPVLLFVLMSAGKAQNGIKYLLPAFPLVMVFLARGFAPARRCFGRLGTALMIAGALLGAAESLRVHPHELMFFNVWAGGPEGGPRYLINGDDWGQDQRRLGEWQRQNHPWRLFYTYYNGDPAHWGIVYETPPCEPQPGQYALHAIEVHRPKRLAPGCLDWLTVEPPDARLGYSIYLYQVTRARIDRLRAERGHVMPFWRSGPE